jgi:hypothetical protein
MHDDRWAGHLDFQIDENMDRTTTDVCKQCAYNTSPLNPYVWKIIKANDHTY